MVLNREKRSNAGRAPRRLDDVNKDTPPASIKSIGSQRVILRVREASQGSKISSKKGTPAPTGGKRAVSTQPASLRRQEDVSTVSPSPEPLLSDFGFASDEENVQKEKEKEKEIKEEVKEITLSKGDSSYTLELSIILGKKGIYNTSIRSKRFYFKSFKE